MSAESVNRVADQDIGARLARRREAYDLSQLAGRLLYDPNKAFRDQHRTVWCHRRMNSEARTGHIYRRADLSGARLTGVTTCGMVRTCKVCAGRVAEKRREELEAGIVAHCQAGGHVYLLTLTAPHDRALSLREFRRLLAKALKRFKNSKTYKRIRAQYGHIGSVRSLELKWGAANGWHLHTHDLYFAQPGLEAARDDLTCAWVSALIAVGLGDQSKLTWMMEHALDLRGGEAAHDYVTKFGHDAKWGLSSEITRSHAKVGMRGTLTQSGESLTMFEVLAWAGQGDAEACRLFREYAEAMDDARMLYWSPGLKAKVGVGDDRDDAEIAADETPAREETNVAQLSDEELALVLSRNALGELLWFVCTVEGERDHVAACVKDFLEALRSRPPTNRGVIRVRRWHERRKADQLREFGIDAFDTVRATPEGLKAA